MNGRDDPSSTTGLDEAVTVVCADEQDEVEIDVARWRLLASAVLDDVGAPTRGTADEMTLTFVSRDEIAELNATHRGVATATDVLSFPLDTDSQGDALRLVGDVVICPAVAFAQSPTHAGSVDDELALLVVHGVLHLFGRDHDEPSATESMQEEERELLRRHHWDGPVPAAFRQEHAE